MLVDDKSQLENGNLRMGTIMKDSCINCNSIIHVAVVDDDNTFGGSLPDFIAAFSRQRSISEQEKEDIKRIFGL